MLILFQIDFACQQAGFTGALLHTKRDFFPIRHEESIQSVEHFNEEVREIGPINEKEIEHFESSYGFMRIDCPSDNYASCIQEETEYCEAGLAGLICEPKPENNDPLIRLVGNGQTNVDFRNETYVEGDVLILKRQSDKNVEFLCDDFITMKEVSIIR